MRDHLDDPTPPSGDRAAVLARARRVRRRRRGLIAGAGTATVAAVVAVAVALQAGSPSASRLVLAEPTTTASQTPSESPSPSPSAAPEATAAAPSPAPPVVGPQPTRRSVASPTPSPTTCESTKYEECRDGKPGYGEGDSLFTCANRTSVPDGETSADLSLGARLELVLPASVRAEGESTRHGPSADLVVHNDSTQRLRVTLSPNEGFDGDAGFPPAWEGLVKGAAHEGSLGPDADPPPPVSRDLDPGATATFPVYLETFECGDTQDDLGPALPPGDYQLGFVVGAHVEPLLDAAPTPTGGPGTGTAVTLGGTLHLT